MSIVIEVNPENSFFLSVQEHMQDDDNFSMFSAARYLQ